MGQIITFPVLTPTKLVAVKGEVVEVCNGLIFARVTEAAEETGIKVGEKIGVSPMQVVKVEEERQ